MQVVLSVAIVQVLVALYLLFTSELKHKSKFFLYILVGLCTIHFSLKFFLLVILKDEFLFHNLVTGFAGTYSLLIYLYIRAYYKADHKKTKGYIIHGILFLAFVLSYLAVGFNTILNYDKNVLVLYRKIIISVTGFPLFGYLMASVLLIKKSKKDNQTKYNTLNNFQYLVYVFMSLMLFFTIAPMLNIEIPQPIQRGLFYGYIVCFIVYLVQHHYKSSSEQVNEETIVVEHKSKYESYKLKPELLDSYSKKLNALMVQKKRYLDPDITLETLAEELKLPKHHLSQVFNEHFHKNFYQYINAYRIGEVQERLKRDNHSNILEIAFACGFNSKSTFNTYFKSITGFTPSKFRQEVCTSV